MSADVRFRERWAMGIEARALVLVTGALIALGIAVVYSATAITAIQANRTGAYFLLRQLTGIAAGLVVFAVVAKVDAERWSKWAWPIMGLALALMLAVLVVGTSFQGSRRFLYGRSIQPSEFAKFAVIIWTSMLVVKKGPALRRFSKGMMPFLVVIGTLDLLAVLEPDLSIAMMFTLIMSIVLFAGEVRIGHFVLLMILGIPVLWHEIASRQYALARLLGFGNVGPAATDISYQLKQSLIGVGSGGLFGTGFGEGRQQTGFLPQASDDFIGSVIGEELGFLGLGLVIALFAAYAYVGFRIAQNARTPFQRLVAVGITATVVITAYVHIGVVIGLLPTTGLTLPFISYGRSNLVLSFFLTGILVNIGSVREQVGFVPATPPVAFQGR